MGPDEAAGGAAAGNARRRCCRARRRLATLRRAAVQLAIRQPARQALTPQQLAQSILDPNAVVSVQNRYVRLTMKDGKTVWGKLLNLDTFEVQIFESTEKLTNVSRKDVRDMTMTSPMPSYRDKLTTQELADVIGYLMSLKGQ